MYYGGQTPFEPDTWDARAHGEVHHAGLGSVVQAVGDVTGDGFDDFAAGRSFEAEQSYNWVHLVAGGGI